MRSLRIAFTGNVFPFGKGHAYGGERELEYLSEGLTKLGHKVYLFAREGTNVKLVEDYVPVPPLTNERDVHFEAAKAYSEKHGIEFDIYQCNYFGEGWSRESQERWPYVELVWNRWCHSFFQLKETPFNVVSYSKRLQGALDATGIKTTMIHYGLPRDLYRCELEKDDYAVWIGKIEAGKAPQLAIQLAKAAGLKIVLMGPPYNSSHFWQLVAPYINNQDVFWVRGVDDEMKFKIMSKAKVFISSNDNSWCEDMGIVNLESLAMGTPIIAFNRINQNCAIVTDKIIEDGKHGFILNYKDSNDLQEILDTGVPLINRIGEINPLDCREQFEARFTADLMARRYEWLFEQVVAGARFGEAEVPF